jgi:hypothetical protein
MNQRTYRTKLNLLLAVVALLGLAATPSLRWSWRQCRAKQQCPTPQ